jgi:hypothetical protein
MYDGLYQRLNTKEGEKGIYRMVKSREEDEGHHPSKMH